MSSPVLVALPDPIPYPVAMTPSLYVATNLDSWETRSPECFAPDVTIRAIAYRRLDPAYYAWLRRRMDRAKAARDSGKLAPPVFEDLRAKFNEVHAWAVAHFGQATLAGALRSAPRGTGPPPGSADLNGILALPDCPDDWPPFLREEFEERAAIIGEDPTLTTAAAEAIARDQIMARVEIPQLAPQPSARVIAVTNALPPVAHRFPACGDFRFTERVSAEAIAMVDAIRDDALRLGWSLAGLYRNRSDRPFPFGPDWGLVTFLHGGRRLGEITRQNAEIIYPGVRETRARFPNMEVDQPWLKRVCPG